MENGHLHDDKLFRAVHDRLSDYDAPYDGADWDAMSRSLDKLPKTSRFQWKFSLNTLLVVAGVAGLSLLGYALTKPGSARSAEQTVPQNPTTQTSPAKQTALNTPASTTPLVSKDPGTTVSSPNTAPEQNSMAAVNPNASKKKKDQIGTDLLFGDQIDKRKGFIYRTQEDPNVIKNFQDTGTPNVYYDVDNGKVRPIIIHKDSSGLKGEKKAPIMNLDSTAKNNSNEGAPTNGEQKGFDFEGNH